jgi:hypothetical protein
MRKAYKYLFSKNFKGRITWETGYGWRGDIRIDLEQTEWSTVGWIPLTQGRIQERAPATRNEYSVP